MNKYGSSCGSCIHLDINDYVRSKNNCYCTERGGYHDLEESKCNRYEYDRNRNYYELNRRWHIVTVICDILELSDKYACVDIIHSFRTNILERDEKYYEFLDEYDTIAPKLAKSLSIDNDKKKLCKRLIEVYLLPVMDLIKQEKYNEAFSEYLKMYEFLKTIYSHEITYEEFSKSK